MKSNCLSTALIAALFLAACEGEPPKVPVVPGAPASAPDLTTETAPAPAAAEAPSPAAAPPCACDCACKGMGAASDAGIAALAPDGGPAPALPAAPPAAPGSGSVVGHVVTTPTGAAANAVVYFEDGPVDPPAKKAAVIDNHMMTFAPFVQVVQVGGRVVFQNSDPFPHNVFSPDSDGFNIGIVAQHASSMRVFKKPATYALLCNLHPGMLGYLVVTPNGHFARTNSTGHYTLHDVPPGTYKVTAWAPRQKPVTQSVTVQGGDASLDFELHR